MEPSSRKQLVEQVAQVLMKKSPRTGSWGDIPLPRKKRRKKKFEVSRYPHVPVHYS